MYTNISFTCECGSVVEHMAFYPVFVADTEKEREEYQETELETECDSCGRPYEVLVKNNFYEVEIIVDNGEIRVEHTEPQYEESELDVLLPKESSQIVLFREQLNTVQLLVSAKVEEKAEYGLHVMLYSHLVASAEGYLYSTFTKFVTQHDSLLRKLVETDPEFSKQKFSLSEIFVSRETLKDTIDKYLKDLIFHNMKKTKEMYLSVLGFDFGHIPWFFRAVNLRHHCVHRGGYDKDGNSLNINSDVILTLMNHLSDLIEAIEVRVKDFDDEGNKRVTYR